MLLVYACEAVLFQDKDAKAVAGIQKFRGCRIMACPDGVYAQFFELPDAPDLEGVRDAGTYTGMVLMLVYSFYFKALAVEEEAFVCVELYIPYADDGLIRVSAFRYLCSERVKVRVLGAPEVGIAYGEACLCLGNGFCKDAPAGDGGRCDHIAFVILKRVAKRVFSLDRTAVLHLCFHGDVCGVVWRFQCRMDKGPERRHMQRLRLFQPHVPIDAGTFIEPSFFQGGVYAHCNDVFSAVVEVFRYVIGAGCITAWLGAQPEAVHPDVGRAENAVKADADVFSVILCRDGESLPVPADARFRILVPHGLVAVAVACLAGVWKVYHPVMREVHLLPLLRPVCLVEFEAVGPGIVDGGRLCEVIEILSSAPEIKGRRRSVSKGELPVCVKALFLPRNAQYRDNYQ